MKVLNGQKSVDIKPIDIFMPIFEILSNQEIKENTLENIYLILSLLI